MANAKDMNPHGVGQRGQDLRTQDGRCRCCELPFKYQGTGPNARPSYCGACLDHYPIPDEPQARRLSRLALDHQRMAIYVRTMREKLDEMASLVRSSHEQTAALQSRDRWRGKHLAAMSVHHQVSDTECNCGDKEPCLTVDAVHRHERGDIYDPHIGEWL